MTKTTSMARTGLLAVLLAMVGFSYSLATSNTDLAVTDAAPRAVGTNPPLAFANPFVAGPGTDRDLGDAVAGSALTRLVRAKGGIPPYTFTAGSLTAFSNNTLTLLSNGILTTVGTAVASGLPNPFRFAVTVKDSFGTAPHTVTETFRLRFVTTTQFRFAASSAADGTQYQPYSFQLPVINGKPAYTFSATNLPSGLGVSKDGVVFGIPTVSGTFTFIATALDANGKTAASRAGTGISQAFSIAITANKTLSSIITVTTLTVKQGFGTNKDSVGVRGVANLGAESIATLSGKTISLRVGSYTAPVVAFDGRGRASSARGVFPAERASIRKFGLFTIGVAKDTINVGTVTGGGTIVLPVEIRIGDAAIGSEYLTFTVKTGRNNSVTLTYKGTVPSDVGGTGQILKTQGSDDRSGLGDAWKVAFIGRIPAALNAGSATSVDVSIGTNFLNNAPLTNKNGKLTFKGDRNAAAVSAFSLDTNRGKGSYTTGTLPVATTGIPIASSASTATPTFFATNLQFKTGATTVYGIASSLAIVPKRTKWSSQ